ncbi:alkaline phosphatase family protein [Prescottella subtropica]|uniref:alkaline phosphatase family protein n=1 Tax=Prescottella subtropica TaxID=2545757 RepID=UPI0010F7B96C|nr:alkaline phosphatase family protein [Prescottella subtropica]
MATSPKRISDFSRRHFLGLSAGAAGIAGAATLLPPSMAAALARPRAAGSLDDVEHVVVLMQENRSFDHYFGTLRGVRGFADNSALPGVFEQSGVRPFRVRDAANRGELSVEYIASLPHGWPDGQQALNGGRCDGWIGAKGQATMAAYDRVDIPFQFALAETFTLCDGYFSSCPTSTSPNRNYLFSGTTGDEPGGGRAVGNAAYDSNHPGYGWRTYAEDLQDAGVDWRVYQEWDNYTDNNLDFFRSFRDIGRSAVATAGEIGGDVNGFFEGLLSGLGAGPADAERVRRADAVHAAAAALPAAQAELYDRALHRGEPGSLARRFRADVEAGSLPAVSWIVTTAADSEHPSASSPIQSSTITYQLLDALASSPEVWRKTVVLIMFDEFDGYFDHVVPPLPPTGEPGEWNGVLPMGLGFRVPLTVISPWSAGGRVCSEVFDHTSVVRFLEQVTGVPCGNISDWRRRVCGDLTATLDFSASTGLTLPAQPGPVPVLEKRWKAEPGGEVPVQETGTATALPTPYRLAADVVDGAVHLVNEGSSAAVFGVFHGAEVAHRTVTGREIVPLPAGTERVVVTGPDRFLRDLRFPAGGSSARVQLDHRAGTITVDGRDLTTTSVRDGWYEVTVPGPVGGQYYTGRLENGKPTRTSPFRSDGQTPEPAPGTGSTVTGSVDTGSVGFGSLGSGSLAGA